MQRTEFRLFFVLASLTILLAACGSADTSTGFVDPGGDNDTETSDGEECTAGEMPTASCPDGGACGAFNWQWSGRTGLRVEV